MVVTNEIADDISDIIKNEFLGGNINYANRNKT